MATFDGSNRDELEQKSFSFRYERMEPLEDATQARVAPAVPDPSAGASDTARTEIWDRIRTAAAKLRLEGPNGAWPARGGRTGGA